MPAFKIFRQNRKKQMPVLGAAWQTEIYRPISRMSLGRLYRCTITKVISNKAASTAVIMKTIVAPDHIEKTIGIKPGNIIVSCASPA